jgi:hypothetical protein
LRFEGVEIDVDFEPGSRLLVLRGCRKQLCGTFYSEWSAPIWRLVRQALLPPSVAR